jgi:dTDP-4-amino-4,6-dideoxygalactose transaminase
MQAALLRVKLRYLDGENNRRREIAARYRNEIKNPRVSLPEAVAGEAGHVWHLFVVRVAAREAFVRHLAAAGIQTMIHYPIPPHRQECYPELHSLSLPITEAIHREVVSLPMSPVMTDAEVSTVVEAVSAFRE